MARFLFRRSSRWCVSGRAKRARKPSKHKMIKINQLLHAGLIISDLEKSRAFYEGLLGLTPNPNRPDFGFPGVWYDIGVNQIHLMAIPDPDADSIRPAHGGRDYHVALLVSDLDAVKD